MGNRCRQHRQKGEPAKCPKVCAGTGNARQAGMGKAQANVCVVVVAEQVCRQPRHGGRHTWQVGKIKTCKTQNKKVRYKGRPVIKGAQVVGHGRCAGKGQVAWWCKIKDKEMAGKVVYTAGMAWQKGSRCVCRAGAINGSHGQAKWGNRIG